MKRSFSTAAVAIASMIGGAVAVSTLNLSCGRVDIPSACADDDTVCPAGPQGDKGDPGSKGDKGDPGDSVWAKSADKVITFDGKVGIGRNTAEVALDVTGNARISGTLSIGVQHIVPTNCVNEPSNSYTDCKCPAGMVVLNGGAYAAPKQILRESRPVGIDTWRVACTDLAGALLLCSEPRLNCVRLGA